MQQLRVTDKPEAKMSKSCVDDKRCANHILNGMLCEINHVGLHDTMPEKRKKYDRILTYVFFKNNIRTIRMLLHFVAKLLC